MATLTTDLEILEKPLTDKPKKRKKFKDFLKKLEKEWDKEKEG